MNVGVWVSLRDPVFREGLVLNRAVKVVLIEKVASEERLEGDEREGAMHCLGAGGVDRS